MFLTDLFNFKKTCSHDKIVPEMECGYCPDCGKFIRNEWYITRCACCGVKLKSVVRNELVYPLYNFCTNCGSKEYLVEKLEKIDFINVNFAVLVKRVLEEYSQVNSTQCWTERRVELPKLPVKYL